MPPVPYQQGHGQTDHALTVIDRWRLQRLNLRKQLLKLMCSHMSSATLNEQETCLGELCGELIDYISIGHFEVYDGLLRKRSGSNHDLRTLIDYLYRCIGSSTDLVLEFNAACEGVIALFEIGDVSDVLGKLTRSLLVRFAIEEQLLELTTG